MPRAPQPPHTGGKLRSKAESWPHLAPLTASARQPATSTHFFRGPGRCDSDSRIRSCSLAFNSKDKMKPDSEPPARERALPSEGQGLGTGSGWPSHRCQDQGSCEEGLQCGWLGHRTLEGGGHRGDHRHLSPVVWAGGDSQAGLQKMRRVDQIPSQRPFLVPRARVLPGSLPLSLPIVPSLCYPMPSTPLPPTLECVSPPSNPSLTQTLPLTSRPLPHP